VSLGQAFELLVGAQLRGCAERPRPSPPARRFPGAPPR
jgi:hypothetical protein